MHQLKNWEKRLRTLNLRRNPTCKPSKYLWMSACDTSSTRLSGKSSLSVLRRLHDPLERGSPQVFGLAAFLALVPLLGQQGNEGAVLSLLVGYQMSQIKLRGLEQRFPMRAEHLVRCQRHAAQFGWE